MANGNGAQRLMTWLLGVMFAVILALVGYVWHLNQVDVAFTKAETAQIRIELSEFKGRFQRENEGLQRNFAQLREINAKTIEEIFRLLLQDKSAPTQEKKRP